MDLNNYDFIIIGCGLTGAVIARQMAEKGKKVVILERRTHIGGNMYDYFDAHGILVQKYGPHIFHTKEKALYEYMLQFEDWNDYHLRCGAVIDGKCTPTPFNFKTIDDFYSNEDAAILKDHIKKAFGNREFATVVEMVNHEDSIISQYARFLFQKDYSLYTAKQWGLSPDEIDVSILKRVPIRFSYDEGYFDDEYEAMPKNSFTKFFENLINHPNIEIELGVNALEYLHIKNDIIVSNNNQPIVATVVYTGALDELFGAQFGHLPYRSLAFKWHYTKEDSYQSMPVVAYPQEKDYTRITEYKKLPNQNVSGTTCAIEYPLQYVPNTELEPYYPVITEGSTKQYNQYKELAAQVKNLVYCGRLGDYKYYNMDQALKRALQISEQL